VQLSFNAEFYVLTFRDIKVVLLRFSSKQDLAELFLVVSEVVLVKFDVKINEEYQLVRVEVKCEPHNLGSIFVRPLILE